MRRRLSGRSGLAAAVLLDAAGAAVVLLAAGRTWLMRTEDRPAPLPDIPTAVTGADLLPWLPASGLVALAAAGALLALRGPARQILGGVLVLAGTAMAVAAGWGGMRPDAGIGWPALGLLGSAAVVAAGCLAVAWGREWPAMGARYERAGTAASPAPRPAEGAGGPGPEKQMWDALDRGEDPTR